MVEDKLKRRIALVAPRLPRSNQPAPFWNIASRQKRMPRRTKQSVDACWVPMLDPKTEEVSSFTGLWIYKRYQASTIFSPSTTDWQESRLKVEQNWTP